MPRDERDLQLLAEVLPNVARPAARPPDARCTRLHAATVSLPAEAREADPTLDKNAAILTMSCHQLLRLAANLSAAERAGAWDRTAAGLRNGDIAAFCARAQRARRAAGSRSAAIALRPMSASAREPRHRHSTAGPCSSALLLNLLSNALKFTRRRAARVSVRVECGERHVQLTVADTGRGIEPRSAWRPRLRPLPPHVTGLDPAPPHGLGLRACPLCRRHRPAARRAARRPVPLSARARTSRVTLPNARSSAIQSLSDSACEFDYAGGFDHVLMELSDALPTRAFLQKYLD